MRHSEAGAAPAVRAGEVEAVRRLLLRLLGLVYLVAFVSPAVPGRVPSRVVKLASGGPTWRGFTARVASRGPRPVLPGRRKPVAPMRIEGFTSPQLRAGGPV